MNDPTIIDVAAIELTQAQAQWVASLSPDKARRFDQLWAHRRERLRRDRPHPWVLTWLLELAEADPGVWSDPIIAAEVERILGPVAEAEGSP